MARASSIAVLRWVRSIECCVRSISPPCPIHRSLIAMGGIESPCPIHRSLTAMGGIESPVPHPSQSHRDGWDRIPRAPSIAVSSRWVGRKPPPVYPPNPSIRPVPPPVPHPSQSHRDGWDVNLRPSTRLPHPSAPCRPRAPSIAVSSRWVGRKPPPVYPPTPSIRPVPPPCPIHRSLIAMGGT